MLAGKLDRRVTILVRSETTHPVYGTKLGSWDESATVWAEVQDVLPSRADRLAEDIVLTRRPARVRMRWRDDVTQANRLIIRAKRQGQVDREVRIVAGAAMIEGGDGLEIMVEDLSTEGQQP